MACTAPATAGTLPALQAEWVREILAQPTPPESAADCANCSMCAHAADAGRGSLTFDRALKCCTYVPILPNFAVGRALRDDAPELAAGRRALRARIASAVAVTPLGLGRGPQEDARYARLSDNGQFGRSREVRCPYYDEASGRCTIWKHRNAVCATWHCKFARGAVGREFWNRLQLLLSEVEESLARWCALELGLEDDALAALERETDAADGSGDDRMTAPERRAVWGPWLCREAEFYVAAAQLVEGLSWDDVVRACGARVRVAERALRHAHRAAESSALPERLVAGSYRVVRTDAAGCTIASYSPLDPLRVPHALLATLRLFDGRPTDQALAAVCHELGLELAPELVAKLVDFRVLVPAED